MLIEIPTTVYSIMLHHRRISAQLHCANHKFSYDLIKIIESYLKFNAFDRLDR